MLQKTGKPNKQVQRTKSWIFDALMQLMDKMPYKKITVSDISEKAGIARPTFYRSYGDKDDVIFEYMLNTFNMELMTVETAKKDDNQNTIVFTFDYQYMVKNKKILKKILSVADIGYSSFRKLQEYPMSLIKPYRGKLSAEEYLIGRYKLCYQINGFLSLFLDWFINDMPMPIEKLIPMINAMNIPKTIQLRNIPSILVKLKNE